MGVPNLTRTDARRRAELLDVTAYEVDLDLTDGAGQAGRADVSLPHDRALQCQPERRRNLCGPGRRAHP